MEEELTQEITPEELIKEPTLAIFRPKTKGDIRKNYPELDKFEALKKCSAIEFKFVWYYKCQSSRVKELPNDAAKIKYAVLMAHIGETRSSSEMLADYLADKIPDNVRKAMVVMASFEPSARVIAQEIVQDTFKNYRSLMAVDVMTDMQFRVKDDDGNPTSEVDWDKANKYTATADRIQKQLSQMVATAEARFGVDEVSDEELVEEGDILRMLHA